MSVKIERSGTLIDSVVLAVLLLIGVEVMFFGGLLSAYTVHRAGVAAWPPLGQPRLPVDRTLLNTVALLLSGWAMHARRYRLGFGLGAFFVLFQGFEWIRLLRFGLTAVSSLYGSFFYLIVGAHAVHALAGLAVFGALIHGMAIERFSAPAQSAARIYWAFVVLLWPVLYVSVYLW